MKANNPPQLNTLVEYSYKGHIGRVIYEGVLDGLQQRTIRSICRGATDFIPIQVGLPFPTPDEYVFTAKDTPFCKLGDPTMVPTIEPATMGYNVKRLYELFLETRQNGWLVDGMAKILKIPETPKTAQKAFESHHWFNLALFTADLPRDLPVSQVTHVALLNGYGGRTWRFLKAADNDAAIQQLKDSGDLGKGDTEYVLNAVILITVQQITVFDVDAYYQEQAQQQHNGSYYTEENEIKKLQELREKYPGQNFVQRYPY